MSTPMSTSRLQRKPRRREIELDFIRGVAILLVMDYHAPRTILLAPLKWLGFVNFGWVGVDVFFVLSGFLIGGLLIKEWKLRASIDGRRFLIRRGFKIWPQYYAFLLVMILTRHRGFHLLWGNFLNIQNYVGGIAHTWTLAVEEHAYLLLAVSLSLASRRRLSMRHLFFTLAASAALVLAWRTVLAAHNVDTFTRTDTRIDGILYGVMIAILYHHAPAMFLRVQSLKWTWIASIVLTLAYFRWNPTYWWSYDLSYVFADTLGIALLFLLYQHRDSPPRPALYRSVAWIGSYSYGIYLWHVSVINPVIYASHLLPAFLVPVSLALAPGLCGVAVGVLASKVVEFPALVLRDKFFPRTVDSAVGIPAQVEHDLGVQAPFESISAEPEFQNRQVAEPEYQGRSSGTAP